MRAVKVVKDFLSSLDFLASKYIFVSSRITRDAYGIWWWHFKQFKSGIGGARRG